MLNKNNLATFDVAKSKKGFTPLEIQRSQFLFRGSKAKPPNGFALSIPKLSGKFLTGFTLIEVVVAISLLIIGLLGVFKVVQDITFSSQIVSSQLTATYLAQEGIEQVRNKRDSNWLERDSNWLDGNAWDSKLPSGTQTGLLGKFTRTIAITGPSPDQKVVSVEVSWQERGKNYSVSVQSHLYKWWK